MSHKALAINRDLAVLVGKFLPLGAGLRDFNIGMKVSTPGFFLVDQMAPGEGGAVASDNKSAEISPRLHDLGTGVRTLRLAALSHYAI